MDRVMLTVSGTAMWLPLYALILWLVWRRSGRRGMLIFTALMLAAIGLADMVSGTVQEQRGAWAACSLISNRARPCLPLRLEGLDITPDSLRVMRREAVPRHWAARPARSRQRHVRHRLGARRDHRRAGRTRLRRDPPPLVHGADGRLLGGDLLLAHSTSANTSRWTSYGARWSAPRWDTPHCRPTAA